MSAIPTPPGALENEAPAERHIVRNDIVRAAAELFSVRGYGRVELEDISVRAGVSVEEIEALLGTKEQLHALAMHRRAPGARR